MYMLICCIFVFVFVVVVVVVVELFIYLYILLLAMLSVPQIFVSKNIMYFARSQKSALFSNGFRGGDRTGCCS